VIVLGSTQSQKTSGLAIPSMLDWDGPVLAACIKPDLLGVAVVIGAAVASKALGLAVGRLRLRRAVGAFRRHLAARGDAAW
jgi:hypothetical protein